VVKLNIQITGGK